MSLVDERLETRNADKAEALGEIASALALIDSHHRDPQPWEQLCMLRAFSLVSAGCYLLAAIEAREAGRPPTQDMSERADEPVLQACTIEVMFEALKEAMAQDARLYPHLGPMALG